MNDSEQEIRPVETVPCVTWRSGFHDEEQDDVLAFRWMGREAELSLECPEGGRPRYLTLHLFSEFSDAGQVVTIHQEGERIAEIPVLQCWNLYSMVLSRSVSGPVRLKLALNKVFPKVHHPGDSRELGIRVALPNFHDDAERHARLNGFHANGLLNVREAIEKMTVLESYPTMLGVDLWGRCNIKPPCVYCFWDGSKDLEKSFTDAVIDAGTFTGYGGFFESARMLQNCSIGEPFLHPQFGEIVELVHARGKLFEMSTNGQMFTPRIIEALAGKKVYLYLSLDAATPQTYARLRNDRWEEIPAHLRALAGVRRANGGWPKVFMVFMPMKANLDDLEPFVRLCKDIEADALVLRPLILIEHDIVRERAGYRFDYRREILDEAGRKGIIAQAERLTAAYGVRLLNQYYFGAADPVAPMTEEAASAPPIPPEEELGGARMPLCREPWQSYFILRRGIFPCCYGYLPIAPMDEWKTAWNSPILQKIRSHLARGTFSPYCLKSLTCPTVQRHAPRLGIPLDLEKKVKGPGQPAWKRAAQRLDRAAFGIPGRIRKRLKGE